MKIEVIWIFRITTLLWRKVEWADSVLIGPGLGRNKSTTKLLIKKLVKSISKPLMLDADGLLSFFRKT